MKKLLILLTLCLPTLAFADDKLEKTKALDLINSTVQIKTSGHHASQGTGVILYSEVSDEDDRVQKTYIITNKHVTKLVGSLCKIKKFIFLKQRNTVGNRQYEAKVVYVSKHHDIALIEIETPLSEDFETVEICSENKWDEMTLYDRLYLVSCGVGSVPCITKGNLSSVNKEETEMGFTAQIIYGSSGGGLYNADGQLIGLGNAIKIARGHPIPHKATENLILALFLMIMMKKLRKNSRSSCPMTGKKMSGSGKKRKMIIISPKSPHQKLPKRHLRKKYGINCLKSCKSLILC